MYPFYLGIDLHLKRTYVVLIDAEGEIIDQRRLLNTEMPEYLDQHVPHETYAVLEATRNWPFMYDLLSDHVERVELAHPKEVKAIANAAVKTDRIDAGVLAHLARLRKKLETCDGTPDTANGWSNSAPRPRTASGPCWPAMIWHRR
jgi:hypothetical protein